MRIEEPAEELPEGSGAEAEPAEPGRPPRHLVWSTDRLDLRDPFQRKWYIRQVLLHGREEDLRTLDLKEAAEILEELNLPSPLHASGRCFWKGKGLLTPAQKEALILLATLPDQEHFYLTGGTALAEFYLGHRISFDLEGSGI
jgi:hypothetical protein